MSPTGGFPSSADAPLVKISDAVFFYKSLNIKIRHSIYCTVPYFGFKAKPECDFMDVEIDCTVPYFGFKAKPVSNAPVHRRHCTVPYFGFKAKQPSQWDEFILIVLCLILDSRQNTSD